MWTVTISLAQMDLSNFRWISRLFYPTTGCHWTHTIFKSRPCATAKWMWHIMTRIDPPLTVLSWLKHRMRTEYMHVHWSIRTWHPSIKTSVPWQFETVGHFKCTFFPPILKWRDSYSTLAKHTLNSQSSEGTVSQKQSFKFPAYTEVTKAL